jgi:transposase/IS5 family transposase
MAFHPIDRDTDFLLPPSVQEWLPQAHLARYVVEVVEQLDLSAMERAYAGRGSDAYHPALLLALLIYGYATGTFSSRRIERATYDSLAFRFIACNRHPDHDTLANFRQRFGAEFEAAFVQVLQVARENQLSRFGTVSLDGTKIHANASRHRALSYGAEKIEAQLRAEVQELLKLAEVADQQALPEGVSLPEEIQRREDRLAAIAAAKLKIEVRAKARQARERAEYEAKLAKRQARQSKSGRGPGGKPPQPPQAGARADEQVNLTDEDSRIMKVAGGGFEQCYNAQGVVDTESMLIMATAITQAGNDKEQVEPMVGQIRALPAGLNQPETLLADAGYFSEKNVEVCQAVQITPLIAVGRDGHHPRWRSRFEDPAPLSAAACHVEQMKHALKTKAGRAAYALRKQTVEPVFGIIKSVMGFRQFLLRGLDNVRHEWTLVCLAWNLKRMAVLRAQ